MIMFVLQAFLTNRRDLGFFIRIISFGAIFIFLLVFSIIGFGFYGLSNTKYNIIDHADDNIKTNFADPNDPRPAPVFSMNFAHLSGVLSVGFFLHPAAVPIIKGNKN